MNDKATIITAVPILNDVVVLNRSFGYVNSAFTGFFSTNANTTINAIHNRNTIAILSMNGKSGKKKKNSIENTKVPIAAANAPFAVALL